MQLYQITRIAPTYRKVLGYVAADDSVSALASWGRTGLAAGMWLEAERVYGFSDEAEVTETMRTKCKQN